MFNYNSLKCIIYVLSILCFSTMATAAETEPQVTTSWISILPPILTIGVAFRHDNQGLSGDNSDRRDMSVGALYATELWQIRGRSVAGRPRNFSEPSVSLQLDS